jgi:hypothetical protein
MADNEDRADVWIGDHDPSGLPLTARGRYYLEKWRARERQGGEERPPDNHDLWREFNQDDE